ncbi:hypothetical protein HDV04_004929 [Boothiomyces sp. JEL0838]|nr:hypothetical protein HDV04_004913 [Boothiomyces sp. JEL0838]KAJ3310601.1 hypothetical protein HDV04_004929 [Boothiomyces sp. JEL0838]
MKSQYKALIVGAGPTGLTVAAELARQGVDASEFLIIDSLNEPQKLTKGTSLVPRTMELLDLYDGVGKRLSEQGTRWTSVNFYSENYKFTSIDFGAELKKLTDYPFFCNVEQWKTELELATYLKARGVQVARGVALESFKDLGDYIQVVLSNGQEIKVDYMVACDGAKSKIRKELGIGYTGTTLKHGSVGIHCSTDSKLPSGIDLGLFYSSKGVGYMLGLPDNTMAIALDLSEEEERGYVTKELDSHGLPYLLPIPQEEIEKLIQKRFNVEFKAKEVVWTTRFRVHHRLADKYSNDNRIFLAGDAGHSSSPSAGLGLNYGVHEAVNIGWKLALVINNLASPELLKTYALERRKEGERLIKSLQQQQDSAELTGMAKYIRNIAMYTFINFVPGFKAKRTRIGALTSIQYGGDLTLNYGKSTATTILAGRQLSPMLFKKLGFSPSAIKGYTAVIFGSKDDKFTNELKRTGVVGMVKVAKERHYKDFQVQNTAVLLVRPDGYIGYRADSLDIQSCLGYLKDNAFGILSEQ